MRFQIPDVTRLVKGAGQPEAEHDQRDANRLHQDAQPHQLVAMTAVKLAPARHGQNSKEENGRCRDKSRKNEIVDHNLSDLAYKDMADNAISPSLYGQENSWKQPAIL